MARPANPLRLNVNVGLGVAFCVLLLTAALSFMASRASYSSADRAEQSYARRIEILRLLTNLREAEAAERAWLLTGDSAFRISYARARRHIESERRHVLESFGDSSSAYRAIDTLVQAKIAFMDSTLTFARADIETARAMVRGGRGRMLMDDLADHVEHLGATERADLAALDARWRSAYRRSAAVTAGLSALTLLFLIIATVVINRDISKRLVAEQRARESESRLFQILEAVPVGLLVVDVKKMRPYYANRASEDILGLDLCKVPIDQIQSEVKSVVAGTGTPYPLDKSPIRVAMSGKSVHVDDIEVIRGDRRIPLESWASPILDENGQVAYAIAAFNDVSKRRTSETDLRELTDELSDFYENAPYGYHSLDAEGCFVRVNRTQLEWLGYSKEEVLGKMHITDVLAPASREAFARDFPRVKLTGMVINRDYEMLRRDGSAFPVMISATAVRDHDGMFVRTRTSVVDLTERRRAEAAERRAREAAEAANRAKSDFLARMSHELRTPLNSIIGFSEVLEDQMMGPLNPKQTRYVHNVLTSGRQLLELVNDVLDLSRIEAGRMDLVTGPMVVGQSLADVIAELEPLSAAKHQAVSLELEPEVGTITADEARFRQIVRNLLANAIKFTPDGGRVIISARAAEGPTAERDWLELAVADTGIGIRPEDQTRIFGEFQQAETPYVQEQTGTGLGLAVTRRLVELHGGRIQVDSTPDQGSIFRVRLPMKGPEWRTQQARDAKLLGGKTAGGQAAPLVLVVDEEPSAADLVTKRLQAAGYRVVVASTGESAVALARQLAPDLITLDILLPSRDGLRVLEKLKLEASTRDIPVVVLSMAPDHARGFSLGAAAWFVKPVLREDLVRVVRRVVQRAPDQKVSALVADADAASRKLAGHYLSEEGFTVIEAATAQEAIDGIIESRPDVIKLDLLLPDRNGFDVVAALRAHPETRDIPIILCTEPNVGPGDLARLRTSVQALLSNDGLREQLLREVQRLSEVERAARW